MLAKLQQDVVEQNCDEGSSSAHNLKGACLNLGLHGLAKRASTLEQELRKEVLEHHGTDVQYFKDALRPLIEREATLIRPAHSSV